jgi:hypothetical protein
MSISEEIRKNLIGKERSAKIGIQASMCGLCMYSCPYTQSYLNNG